MSNVKKYIKALQLKEHSFKILPSNYFEYPYSLIIEECKKQYERSKSIDLDLINIPEAKECQKENIKSDSFGEYEYSVRLEHAKRISKSESLEEQTIENMPKFLSSLSKKISDIIYSEKEIKASKVIKEAIDSLYDRVSRFRENKGVIGIKTCVNSLTEWTGGWQPWFVVIAARPSIGKAVHPDTPVMTPNGYVKMSEVREGDYVTSIDGSKTKVLNVYNHKNLNMYNVTFSDGANCICCEDHLWSVNTRKKRKCLNYDYETLSTSRLLELGVMAGNRNNFKVPTINGAVVFDNAKADLPIDPWIVGAYIGDGCFSTNYFYNTEPDVVSKFSSLLPSNFFLKSNSVGSLKHSIKSKSGRDNFINEIKKIGLCVCQSYDKYIPHDYKYSTPENRLKILQGLIDTDGYVVSKKSSIIEYSTTSKQLALDVKFIAESLGCIVVIKSRIGRYTKNGEIFTCRENYRVMIRSRNGVQIVSSKKHLARFKPNLRLQRYISSIEPVGKSDGICITVDHPSNLYIINDGIVTHNTQVAVCEMVEAIDQGYKPVFFSIEMSRQRIMDRMILVKANVDAEKYRKGMLSDEELSKVEQAVAYFETKQFVIDDYTGATADYIVNKLTQYVNDGKCDIAYCDYIQITKSSIKDEVQKIVEVCDIFKDIPKLLGIPFIALAQINRASLNSGDLRPKLFNLKGSSAIEEAADLVILLHRPWYYGIREDDNGNSTLNMIEYCIPKFRDGQAGNDCVIKCYHNYCMTQISGQPFEDPNLEPYKPSEGMPPNAASIFDNKNIGCDDVPF